MRTMNPEETLKLSWHLLVTVRRIGGEVGNADDERQEFFEELYEQAVHRYGHHSIEL